MALVALLLLAAPGFDAAFDPLSDARVGDRKQAFEAAVKAKGLAAAIKRFRTFEKDAAELQKRIDKVYATYVKAADAYWGYRKKTGAVAEAVPAKLNKPFLDWELAWKRVTNKKRRLRSIHEWAEGRARELYKASPDKRAASVLKKGLKDRNPSHRARCRAILEGPPKPPPPDDGAIEVFGLKTGAKRIVFVFDRPEVLGGPVAQAIDALPAGTEFGVVVSGWTPRVWRRKLSTDKAGAKEFIKKRKDKRSDLHAALVAAIDLKPDVILLGTAAGPWSGGPFTTQVMFADPLQVTQEILAYNRTRGVRIHAAGPSGDRNGNWLQKLCAQFGGSCNAR